MKAGILYGAKDIRIGEVPTPEIQPDEVLVESKAAGICGTDLLSAVHFKTLVLKEAEIIASRVTRGEFPRALRMMSRGLLHPDLLITGVQPLDDITAAFAQVDREESETIKIGLEL